MPKHEVFYLPPDASEYNPDERLNSDLKRGIGKRISPRSDNEPEHNERSHLKSVQLKPNKIMGFSNLQQLFMPLDLCKV
ncbi:MAG: transposase [Candidatus Accumulibacter sp.]|jgi:hypothetical protein|nr:transposase [Accumulibacter sp.]